MTSTNREVLILGGTGFIGAPLAKRLSRAGATVTTVSRSQDADITMDARDEDAVRRVLTERSYDAVINLMGAGLATATVDETTLTTINAHLPTLLLTTLLEHHPRTQVVHAASSTERTSDDERDESEYSRTKHEGAQSLRELAIHAEEPVTLLRIHNTYGPDQPVTRFVAGTIEALSRGEQVRLNYPHRVRDFVFIDDVVDSIVSVLNQPQPGLSEVELGTGIGTSLIDVALAIAGRLLIPGDSVTAVEPLLEDPHPYAVATHLGGGLGICVTTLDEGLARTIGER